AVMVCDVLGGWRLRYCQRGLPFHRSQGRGSCRGFCGRTGRGLRVDGAHHRTAVGPQGMGSVVAMGRAADLRARDVAGLRCLSAAAEVRRGWLCETMPPPRTRLVVAR